MNFILIGGGAAKKAAGPEAAHAAAALKPRAVDLARLNRVVVAKTESEPDNRRAARRKATRMPGDIAVDERHWLACTVHDISATGAMVEVHADRRPGRGADGLPDRFYLVMESALERSLVECLVRWRKGERAGVQFMGPLKSSARVVPARPARKLAVAGGRR